jgi:hypothetical protein
MSKGYIIKKYKRDRSILYDGIIYKNYDIANAILNRLSEEWEIEEVDIYD